MEAVELFWAFGVGWITAVTWAGMAQAGTGEPGPAQPHLLTPTGPPERHCAHGSPVLWDMTVVWANLSHALAFTCCQIPSGVLVPHSAVRNRLGHPAAPRPCYSQCPGAAGRGPGPHSMCYIHKHPPSREMPEWRGVWRCCGGSSAPTAAAAPAAELRGPATKDILVQTSHFFPADSAHIV